MRPTGEPSIHATIREMTTMSKAISRRAFAKAAATASIAAATGCSASHAPADPRTEKDTRTMNASRGRSPDHEWPGIDSFVLSSARLRQELKVSIARLPAAGRHRGHMTAYVLDPAFNFQAAVAIGDFLGRFAVLAGGSWPEIAL